MPDLTIATTLYLDTTTSIANNDLVQLPFLTETDTISLIAIVSGLLVAISIIIIVCASLTKSQSKEKREKDTKKSAAGGQTLRVEFKSRYEDGSATPSYTYKHEVAKSQRTKCHVDIDAYHDTDGEHASRSEDSETTPETTQTTSVSAHHFNHEPQYCVSQILVDFGDDLQKPKTGPIKSSGYDCPYPDSQIM